MPAVVSAIYKPQKRIGDILLERELVTEEQLAEVFVLQKKLGRQIGQILVEQGMVADKDLMRALAEQYNLSYVWLRPGIYDPEALALLGKRTALRLEMMPIIKVRSHLYVATNTPQAIPELDEIESRTGLKVKPVLACRADIIKAINESFSELSHISDFVGDLEDDFEVLENQNPDDFTAIDEMAEGSPIVNLVNSIIQRAVKDKASDIHIEPSRTKCRVRMRIDGVLYEIMSPKIKMHAALVSRLKVMANLDIAERRLPQDGRIQVNTRGRVVDLRFSSLPGIFGEKVVLRVLDKDQSILEIDKLGMSELNEQEFRRLLQRSSGLLLVTGPTGSGKTTTLYAAINHLNSLEKNIVTIEDPVEYQLDIVNQNQVKESIGLGFAMMLKHILRQDPDIIMVGEIRDRETAEIAVQASLTGHLVLSTLHTNSCVGAISRLLEMGVEPFLLSSALSGVIGQRLVRTVCPACKTTYIPGNEMVEKMGMEAGGGLKFARGRGCPECYDSGYKGRIAIHEILATDSNLQRLMNRNPTNDDLERYVTERELVTIFKDGYQRVRQGLTTPEEISRIVNL
jgi:type IV pilus assembly protein PilB